MSDTLTKEEIREIVRATVDDIFTGLGLDVSDPIEAQRDMRFVRDWRRASESVKGKALVTVIGVIVCGAAGAMFLGLKALLLRP